MKIGRPSWNINQLFWNRLEIIPFSECWHWLGSISKDGYGKLKQGNKYWSAHRYSLYMHGIELNPDLVVDHICKNRSCVNPNHLRQVTKRENVIDFSISPIAINSRKTHCPKGHLITGKNLNKPGRWCRICKGIKHKEFKNKNPNYNKIYNKTYYRKKKINENN